MTKTIFHYAGTGRNYGDMALAYAMHSMFVRRFGPVHIVPIDLKQGTVITPEFVEQINNVGDMLVIGGGGLLMPGDGHRTVSGWQFNITEKALESLNVPLVAYAIGYNEFPYNKPIEMDEAAWRHVKLTAHKAALFSVRDTSTVDALWLHGMPDVAMLPDPALMAPSRPSKCAIPGIPDNAPVLGLNLAGDRLGQRFGGFKQQADFFKGLVHHLIQILKQNPELYLLGIPHVSKYDFHDLCEVLEQVARAVGHDRAVNLQSRLPWLYPESYSCVPYLYSIYERCSAVVGMRGHSNLIPYSVGTPFVALGDHSKTDSFANMTNMPSVDNSVENLTQAVLDLLDYGPTRKIDHDSMLKEMLESTNGFLDTMEPLLGT